MSGSTDEPEIVPSAAHPAPPGALVRAAREAAGLSVADVAQQLKLAPRQVQALEADDYAHLPGRTFVRGFLRNYARLLGLDADALLAALPDTGTASLDRPTLAPTTRVMGELPADASARTGSARWVVPLAFVAIVAIAAAYLWQPARDRLRGGAAAEHALPMPAGATAPAGTSAASNTDASTPPTAPPPTEAAAPSAPATAAPAADATSTAAPAASDTPLVLVFRGTSWVEVKDARGNVLLSTMGYPGATHAVGGLLPLEVVVGNAEAVQVAVRGEAFDTAPYVKQNVAKFQVK